MHFLNRVRVIVTTATATAAGLFNIARTRDDIERVALVPGDIAPDFAIEGSDGLTYRLSALKGQTVVLAWFPKAFTGGCTAECESIGASSRMLQQYNVAYFGASVDTAATNREFARAMGVAFPILGDPGRSVARAYGVLGKSGFPARWTFYIDPDGRIRAIDKQVRTGTHGADIEKALVDLQVAQHS